MASSPGVTVVSMPYELFTHDTYEVTLREFTKVVPIPDAETMRTITRHLEYKKATLGRALVCDLPQLGLRKGWRLEPCPGLPDVGQFEFTPLPFDCTFWVGPEDGRLTHGCPLFDIPGLTWESWAIDIMHSWHLGPLQQLVSLTLHFCIGSGLFAPKTIHLNASDRQQMSLLVIKSELFLFYQQLRELDPEWKRKGTEVWNLTLGMLGNQETYNLSCKAAESHGLLRFIHWFLDRHLDEFRTLDNDTSRTAELLLAAAKNALQMDEVLGLSCRKIDLGSVQKLLNCYIRFLLFYGRAGGVLKPKFHLLFHMIQRALYKGNPRAYSTYRDESLNGIFAKIARSAHRRTWANVIHWKASMFHKKAFDAYVSDCT
ncbi:unnamed protein product [Symbiodinium sp. CCMP2592]|nr:unnamed protein product [Symbiodinium sp. CCMP2592]